MENLSQILKERKLTISVAESCTGGLLASTLTNEPGSSLFFKGGIVAYNKSVKEDLLKIPKGINIVSNECAIAMNYGLYRLMNTDICISVTGYIGPFTNDYDDQGEVYYSIFWNQRQTTYKILCKDTNDRENDKKQIIEFIIESLTNILRENI